MSRREVSLFDDAAATRKIMSTRTICCGLVLVAVIFNSGYCHAVPVEQQQHSRLRRAAQEGDDGPLPFIQFTKGGIRVNFGGYHAQAGLGGLLTGRAADGGLHASAGIENGPSASAGLGGSLENGPKGGLHARAGLGGGGPEAEAGLSGSLAGPKPTGDIYSRAQLANGIEVAKTKGKNVQIIPRPKKATEQDQYAASGATAAALNREPSGEDDEALKKSHPARWYFEKRVQERIAAAGQTTAEPTSASSTTDSNAISEQAVTSGSSSSSSSSSSTNINNSSNNSSKEKNSGGRQTSGIYSRATASASNDDAIQDTGRPKHRSTLFDDIFNIPISALNAVNKLLKNHVGKK